MTSSPPSKTPVSIETEELDTKRKILNAALEDFSSNGLAGSRVDKIAEKAGVNKAMLYYHFSSKENLYKEVLETFFKDASGMVSEILSSSKNLEDALEALNEFYSNLFTRQPAFTPIFLRELAHPKSKLIKSIAEIVIGSKAPAKIKRLFKLSQKKGQLREVSIRHAIVIFLTLNIGYFVCAPLMDRVWNIDNRESFIRQWKKEVLNIFLHGIKTKKR